MSDIFFIYILFLHLEVWWVQNVMRAAIIYHSDSQIRSRYPLSPPVQNYGNIKSAYTKCLKQETKTSCSIIITWSLSGLVSDYVGHPKNYFLSVHGLTAFHNWMPCISKTNLYTPQLVIYTLTFWELVNKFKVNYIALLIYALTNYANEFNISNLILN
jgi:hypothetical protein